MIPPPFEYAAPKSLDEAIRLLGQDENAKVLAGGQSLLPLMRFRLASPDLLVDINHITGLDAVHENGNWLMIGALARESALDHSDLVHRYYPLLADTTRMVADPLVRNLATLGGNLSHADPANDHPATMLAYGAQVVARGPKGERTIPIETFFIGPFESALAHDEILTEIRIPKHQPGDKGAYIKMERRVGDFATAAVAVQLRLDNYGQCTQVGIGLTNVGLTPIKAKAAEEKLKGRQVNDTSIREAAQMASEAADPQEDNRGSVEYKRALVKTLTSRALHAAMNRSDGGMQ